MGCSAHKGILHRRVSRLIGKVVFVAILAFGLSPAFELFWSVNARAQNNELCPANPNVKDLCAKPTDECLKAALKVDLTPKNHRVLQLVNCSTTATLLGAANAAQNKGSGPTSVFPRESTWVMAPFNPADTKHKNVLVVDVPPQWENTKCGNTAADRAECEKMGVVGPRLWARTGCRYDVDFDWAQCETGGCSGRYDCSAAKQNSSTGTTVSEWTLYEPVVSGDGKIKYEKDSPDISAVDGVNLNMDIRPVGGCPRNPFDYELPLDENKIYDPQWLNQNCPLTEYGKDLRDPSRCQPAGFQFKRSDLTGAVTGDYGFVEIDKDGKPIGGDANPIGCFSNCGKYAWPTAPQEGCDLSKQTCLGWRTFCAGDPADYWATNTTSCGPPVDDLKCKAAPPQQDQSVFAACWDNPGSATDNHCNVRAFIKNFDPMYKDNGGCDPNICTFPYLYKNPITGAVNYGTQPPFGLCDDVKLGGSAIPCIGDDTMHGVMRKAYTWPNDPQVYGGNAPAYQIVIAPGDTTVGITDAGPVPFCDDKVFQGEPYEYDTPYEHDIKGQHGNCKVAIDYGAIFDVAHPFPALGGGKNQNWSCDIDPTGSGNEGVLCKWREPFERPIYQVGLRVNSDTKVTSLNLDVIPGVKDGDLLLASITYFSGAKATPPAGWTQVPGASVSSQSLDQTTVWYRIAKEEPISYTWNWDASAYPAGAITVWRGVDNADPFDGITASTDSGIGLFAHAPSLTTKTANSELISVFGAGGGGRLAFQGPVGIKPDVGRDEAMGAKVIGGIGTAGIDTWYGHLVADRPQVATGLTKEQQVQIIPIPEKTDIDWTGISIVLKPAT